jgi:hypothetical protein
MRRWSFRWHTMTRSSELTFVVLNALPIRPEPLLSFLSLRELSTPQSMETYFETEHREHELYEDGSEPQMPSRSTAGSAASSTALGLRACDFEEYDLNGYYGQVRRQRISPIPTFTISKD